MDELDEISDKIKKLFEERDRLYNALKKTLVDANYWANKYFAESIARTKAEQKLKENENVITVWRRRTEEAEAKLTKLRTAAERVQSVYSSYYTEDHRIDCWQQLSVALKETE